MRSIICRSGALALVLALSCAGVANADSALGTTTMPSGSTTNACASTVAFGQSVSASSTPYALSTAGVIKRWSTNVTGATPGADLYFLVLRGSGSSVTVVGVDHETVPASLPVSGVATFTPSHTILAQAGDYLGLYSPSSSETCFWSGSGVPSGATTTVMANPGPAPLSAPPTRGQTLQSFTGDSAEVNVSAVVAPAISDVAVSAAFVPARSTSGALTVLAAKVVNHGPQSTPVTFRDILPNGLHGEAANAGGGRCSIAGQQVTCTIANLASGRSSLVRVIVLPTGTRSYTDSDSVSPEAGVKDPNLANNSSTATLNVVKPGPTTCTVPELKATPAGVAEQVLKLLGCGVNVQSKKGHGVPKGTVLKTNPGSGTYALNRKITLIVRK